VNIFPEPNGDDATLTSWLEIIESRCPVNDNPINPTPVKIGLKIPAEKAA
jgi:hypothetical protein